MHNEIQCARNLSLNCGEREIGAAERHGLEPCQHIGGRIGMTGREGAVVAGIHRLQHIEGLGAAHFADNDAVGVHAETGANQVGNANLALPFGIPVAGFKAHQIFDVEKLELRGILNRDDAFGFRNKSGECV